MTIKDTPERIAAAARVLAAIDKARPEVIIDVELLEVNRTKLIEYGLQIASPASPAPTGLNGSVSIATDAAGNVNLQTLRNLTASDVIFTALPALYYRLLKTDAQHAHPRESAVADRRWRAGAGGLRRARPHPGDDVCADRHGRAAAAADHLVQLSEHRGEHRHHAAHASRRRCDAGVEGVSHQHLRDRLWRAADVRQPRGQHHDPPAGRRNEHARRVDS